MSVQGTRRDLHPIVREEGLLIGREAMANAFRHANARNIEAEVTYGDVALHVRIRDDGRGINAAVLDAGGKPGHFGLIGMRERAKKLGAHLEVWSKPGAGTEVDLRVPADVAYRRARSGVAPYPVLVGSNVMNATRDPETIRILTVDDHQLLREGIAAVLESQADMTLVGQASNGREAIESFRRLRPDVTLMDLRMPDMSGIEAITAIRAEFPMPASSC